MSRKQKLHFEEFVKLVEYYAFSRGKFKFENGMEVRGTVYRVDNISNEIKERLLTYDNVLIGSGHYKYAPEIKAVGIFVGDKCFKSNIEN